MKNKLSNLFLVSKGNIRGFLFALTIILVCVSFSFATTVAEPKLVSGTKNLFQAISLWLTGLIPIGAGCVAAYFAFLKTISQDDADIADKNKKIKNVIVGGIIATSISGLVTLILSFYN